MATVDIEVEVTQADIDEGVAGDCDLCPIARAARRAGLYGVMVSNSYVIGNCWDASLPQVARDFIRVFDDDATVRPFTFTLAVPAKVTS